jgi:hypothetical protein
MRLLNTVIFTDKLDEVRAFWQRHFLYPVDEGEPNSFGVMPFPYSKITYIDAAAANMTVSRGIVLRLAMEYPPLERARLLSEGVACSELQTASWGTFYGTQVQYFTLNDPAGTTLQIFVDRFGDERQLMTTGDGTGTKKVQERQKHEQPDQANGKSGTDN